MVQKYRLEKIQQGSKWDSFVSASPNGTIFSYTDYVNAINAKCAFYYCFKGQEVRGAVAVVENSVGDGTVLHDFIIYNGVMFAPPANRQNRAQQQSEQFRVCAAIAEQLPYIYKKIIFSLHPTVQDIRAFQWVNYGTSGPKYHFDLKYTSYVNISDFRNAGKLEEINLYLNASSARRQEIRYAIKKDVKTVEEFSSKKFIEFYYMTMHRQSIQINISILEELRILLDALYRNKLGRMFVSYDSSGRPGSMAFFGIDSKRAYYLFGANDPEMRSSHTGTSILWDAFRILSRYNIDEVDLEGVNSPERGWFKLSYGGSICPYFHIFMDQ